MNTKGERFAVTATMASWICFFPGRMETEVRQFIGAIKDTGRGMGFNVPEPRMYTSQIISASMFNSMFILLRVVLQQDRTNNYTDRIRDECSRENYNMIMACMTTIKADTYGAIKKLLCAELGIPSQVNSFFFSENPEFFVHCVHDLLS